MARTQNKPDWSSLPSDLLNSIAKCLPARVDVLRFRAVCRSIRSSVLLPPKPLSPYLRLKIPLPSEQNGVRGYLLLTRSAVYAVEPLTRSPVKAKAWLIRVEERNSGKVIAKSVLSQGKLPRRKLPRYLNLLDYRIKEVSKDYNLEFVPDIEIRGRSVSFRKVVASASFDEINDDFALMAILDRGKLVFWRYGDKEWTDVMNARNRYFDEIVYHSGKFFALNSRGGAIIVDPNSLGITEVDTPPYHHSRNLLKVDQNYLLKSDGDLFLILKSLRGDYEDRFDWVVNEDDDGRDYLVSLYVFKLNKEKLEWVQVTDGSDDSVPLNCDCISLRDGLDNRVLFLGSDSTFSVSAKEFSLYRKDCVYFHDRIFYRAGEVNPGESTAIFDLKEKTAQPLHTFPGHYALFWPPRAWLRLNSRLAHP